MGRPTMGAWSAPLHPVKPHLFADQVPETFQRTPMTSSGSGWMQRSSTSKAASRPKGPPLEYIFSWVSEDQIECQGCHYKALRYEEDMDLSLPISKGFDQQDSPQDVASIQEALSLYTTKEVMDGDNKFSCP
ncbi:hypothetical protein WJX82_011504 [Trebouxia sp. C0006]